jgi:hypothetical protein
VIGVELFCSEFRVHAALGPPKGGTPNFKMSHYPVICRIDVGLDLGLIHHHQIEGDRLMLPEDATPAQAGTNLDSIIVKTLLP